jgi:hypothetical protein
MKILLFFLLLGFARPVLLQAQPSPVFFLKWIDHNPYPYEKGCMQYIVLGLDSVMLYVTHDVVKVCISNKTLEDVRFSYMIDSQLYKVVSVDKKLSTDFSSRVTYYEASFHLPLYAEVYNETRVRFMNNQLVIEKNIPFNIIMNVYSVEGKKIISTEITKADSRIEMKEHPSGYYFYWFAIQQVERSPYIGKTGTFYIR